MRASLLRIALDDVERSEGTPRRAIRDMKNARRRVSKLAGFGVIDESIA